MQDHPRIRGEHRDAELLLGEFFGSSPHTRGARLDGEDERVPRRIIPAYAGSTKPTAWTGRRWRDHPRIRGEHDSPPSGGSKRPGSSPHTRGAHVRGGRGAGIRRIIPAYAGSTTMRSFFPGGAADHPRIRGEHSWTRALMPAIVGSSPHTRGALDRGRALRREVRIIPAYAGSTLGYLSREVCVPDHPRIRGEHHAATRRAVKFDGSSPHTRGARSMCRRRRGQRRIIPAYAGSTRPVKMAPGLRTDHPRIRGEHWSRRDMFNRAKGSSPHTRGALVGAIHLHRMLAGSSPHTRGARVVG